MAGLVGFAITIITAWLARRAALAAKAASEQTRRKLRFLDTIVDFQSAISALEDIKRLHREKAWAVLPEKYAATRRLLISLRDGEVELSDEEQSIVQGAVANLSDIERQIETSLARNTPPKGSERLNPIISGDSDALVALLQSLKRRSGETNG